MDMTQEIAVLAFAILCAALDLGDKTISLYRSDRFGKSRSCTYRGTKRTCVESPIMVM